MLEPLPQRECIDRLGSGCVGRVGLVADGVPHVLPVNYASEATGMVVFRTMQGTLLSTIAGQRVVFEIDGFDRQQAQGWSVCVHGTAREVSVPTAEAARSLAERSLISWAPGPRDRWFAIEPEEVTGRSVALSGDLSDLDGWIQGVVS